MSEKKYIKLKRLGEKGKEGITYLVKDKKGNEYAMKTFKKTKSSKNLKKEYDFLKLASEQGISPKVYDYNLVEKYIVMEKMDSHLYEYIDKHEGKVKIKDQKRIIEIFKKLDEINIFHNDPNICNYMLKNNIVYLIDYGLSKEITPKLIKNCNSKNPNTELMSIGFILKLKEKNIPEKSYFYIKSILPQKYIELYDL